MKTHLRPLTLPKSASKIIAPNNFWDWLAQALGLKQF